MGQTIVLTEFCFVCSCGAKYFHRKASIECPRCGRTLTSEERLVPPWIRQLEQHEDREARILTERLLLSRGLNPDQEPMLGRIVREHFLHSFSARKEREVVPLDASPTLIAGLTPRDGQRC